MRQQVTTTIDPERCVGCGACVEVCPARTITLVDGKARITGDESLNCGHCEAVCPNNAVAVNKLDNGALDFATFRLDRTWLNFAEGDTAELVRLMVSRRSCRNYSEQPVEVKQLQDLVKIGTTAPSGTNSQLWTFTVLPTRQAVMALGQQVALFFGRINKLAKSAVVRNLLRLVGKPELHNYFHEHLQGVEEALVDWQERGLDRLFHGATAGILVGSKRGGSCPAEDALLATQNILLAAHTMGLGSCLIGYVVEAMAADPKIGSFVGIPKTEKVHAVIALGQPQESYQRSTGRFEITPRFFEGTSAPTR